MPITGGRRTFLLWALPTAIVLKAGVSLFHLFPDDEPDSNPVFVAYHHPRNGIDLALPQGWVIGTDPSDQVLLEAKSPKTAAVLLLIVRPNPRPELCVGTPEWDAYRESFRRALPNCESMEQLTYGAFPAFQAIGTKTDPTGDTFVTLTLSLFTPRQLYVLSLAGPDRDRGALTLLFRQIAATVRAPSGRPNEGELGRRPRRGS